MGLSCLGPFEISTSINKQVVLDNRGMGGDTWHRNRDSVKAGSSEGFFEPGNVRDEVITYITK